MTTMRFLMLVAGLAWSNVAIGQDAAPSAAKPARDTLTVAAAASMQFALDDLVPAFEKKNPGIAVKVVTGASGSLVAQINQGAPFDMFLSADTRYPRELVKAKRALEDSMFVYAVGSLVVWTRKDSGIDIERLGMQALTQNSVRKIAIANPAHAPYGEAALAAMKNFEVYGAASNKIVLGENIAQALQFAESGNADVGIIASSLVAAPLIKDIGRYWVVPAKSVPRIEQAGVVLSGAKSAAAAQEFRKFILGEDGRAIMKKNGFSLPDGE